MSKKTYEERKQQGLCVFCGSPYRKINNLKCDNCIQKAKQKYNKQKHREYDLKYKNKLYNERKESNLCVVCGKVEPLDDATKCFDCSMKHRKNLKKHQTKVYADRKELGLCKCGAITRPGKRTCQICTDRNLAIYESRKERGVCNYCKNPSGGRTRCEECSVRYKEKAAKLRQEVFDVYGGAKCACCGETIDRFLTLDHMNNDGSEHRRTVGRTSVLKWLKDNNYPPGYQVLCFNCNMGKHLNGGVCPHKSYILH